MESVSLSGTDDGQKPPNVMKLSEGKVFVSVSEVGKIVEGSD